MKKSEFGFGFLYPVYTEQKYCDKLDNYARSENLE